MRYRYPWPLKVARFVEHFLSFNQLNVSRADILCVLENDIGEAARSTQPVTLYITVNITPPTLYNNPPSRPTADDGPPAEEAPIRGRIRPPSPGDHPLPLSHHKPAEAGNNKPQSRKEAPSTTTKDPRSALDGADHAIKQMDRLDTLKGAIGKIKWVMDTLGPIAEVRVIPFDVLS
jgi:hypothetical protein